MITKFKLTKIVFLFALAATGWSVAAADEKATAFINNPRQLIFDGERSGEGYFSSDGKLFIFASEREPGNPFYQIYVLDMATGETRRISNGTGKTTCAFFQPGNVRALYASTHLDRNAKKKQKEEIEFRASGKERRYSWDYDENYDIFATNLDGSGITRLTNARGYDAEAAYSPDGSRIVFCSVRDAYPLKRHSAEEKKRLELDPSYFGEIYIMNADGSEQTRLTDWPGYDGGPFFSPDGTRILWRHFDESGAIADIYTMKTDGTDRRRITEFESMSWAPYYHPSSKYIIFTSNLYGFGNFELFVVDAAGTKQPVRVTTADGFDGLPVFSPDGARLTWTSNRTSTEKSQIFIGEWDHEAVMAALAAAPMREGARSSFEISAEGLRESVGVLASDEMEGRLTGTDGTAKAADYIVGRFSDLGLATVGDATDYRHAFPFTAGMNVVEEKCLLEIKGNDGSPFKVGKDFTPLAFTSNDKVEGGVVFAGYGLTVPGERGAGYDSYAGLDVRDKIVIVLRYTPEDVDMERKQELNRYAGLRYKAMMARENGAKALLIVTGPNSPNSGELIPLSYDQSTANSGIVVASISGDVGDKLLAASGKNLEALQTGLDTENPHAEGGFEISGVELRMVAEVEREEATDYNIVGVIPPAPGNSEYVLVGAHYDHIGRGEIGSLARKGERGQVHNGADDNASGTAVVLELAAALAERSDSDPEISGRGIIFALWSGEEMGLIGSTYFANNSPVPLANITAYLNFDMVGRLRNNKLVLQGVGSSSIWKSIIQKRNLEAGFDVTLQDDPYLPTDVTAFYPKEIPVMSFFTGSHEDYNRPTDDSETLNFDGMERITRFAVGVVEDLAAAEDRPDYANVERSKSSEGQRASLRAYLGTIPDYATEGVAGVKLSGVRPGGPADKAGLKGGDIIVKFGGQEITNIYDYTYALGAVKIGQAVEVVVLRGDKHVNITVIPEARK